MTQEGGNNKNLRLTKLKLSHCINHCIVCVSLIMHISWSVQNGSCVRVYNLPTVSSCVTCTAIVDCYWCL